MAAPNLPVDRERILAHRRRATGLDERARMGDDALRRAASAGLTDSVPRAAVLSIHARVADTPVGVLDDPGLVQVWGPRFSAYVVGDDDRAPFTLGRLPASGAGRERAFDTAKRLADFLDGRTMSYAEAGRGMEIAPNMLRYGALTGTVLIRWEGFGRPLISSVPAPDVTEDEARSELARRFLHALGPATTDDFARWAGVRPAAARAAFAALDDESIGVTTPVGDAAALATDEPSLRAESDPEPHVHLLPSGDVYFLLWGVARQLLVPDAARRDQLWTSRVWPGALLVDGEIVGVWRRSGHDVTVTPWTPTTATLRSRVEEVAAALPLPVDRPISVAWDRDP